MSFGGLTFLAPLALLGLLSLPLIWWILRVTPPKPIEQAFPPLRILQKVETEEETPNSTPLWLLLFRLFLVALVAIALAQPIFKAAKGVEEKPITLIVDNGWDSAPNWNVISKEAENRIADARRKNIQVKLVSTADLQEKPEFIDANNALNQMKSMRPLAKHVDRETTFEKLANTASDSSDVLYFSSGVYNNIDDLSVLERNVEKLGGITIYTPNRNALPLIPGSMEETVDGFRSVWHRTDTLGLRNLTVTAHGSDGRVVSREDISFAPGQSEAEASFDLPTELRSRVTLIRAEDSPSAGSVKLLDDSWGRPLIGVLTEGQDSGSPLLSEPFYAETALKPYADVFRGNLDDLIPLGPSIIVMPDAARTDSEEIKTFVENGGLLIRFAGPKLAKRADEFIPVRLREGGRELGGALTWEEPQKIAEFTPESPFFGLDIPEDVQIKRQIMAEPGAETDSRTWARLADGSPIVTSKDEGFGRIVLFHVTASPDWSNLPVSGLYVNMLRRLLTMAKSSSTSLSETSTGDWAPERVLNGYGRLTSPDIFAKPIAYDQFDTVEISETHPPGLYRQGPRRKALNFNIDPATFGKIDNIRGAQSAQYGQSEDRNLTGRLLTLALILLALDALFSIWISGRGRTLKNLFKRPAKKVATFIFLICFSLFFTSNNSHAQDNTYFENALELRFAFVKTGDIVTDRVSERALEGLVDVVKRRTTIEPVGVIGIDPSVDTLEFYPFLYWPVSRDAEALTDDAVFALNDFMASGGTIIFDTKDSGDTFSSETNPGLKRVTERLDIPALQQIPKDHVLNKSYYLIDIYPGRWANGPVWVDKNQNGTARDGVSSVIIGGNDWAEAWQQSEDGTPLGTLERDIPKQREMALRFGVNIAMYSLAGNYKADQVHSKELIERQKVRDGLNGISDADDEDE